MFRNFKSMFMRLGDLVYYITYYTGIHFLVKKISKLLGFDCGCDERRESWNKYQFKIKDDE